MPPINTIERLRRLVLSAADLRSLTDWPDQLIEDYLGILEDLITLASLIDIDIDAIAENASLIETIQAQAAQNRARSNDLKRATDDLRQLLEAVQAQTGMNRARILNTDRTTPVRALNTVYQHNGKYPLSIHISFKLSSS